MDVMLTLALNGVTQDGVATDRSRTRREFPYFGDPYTKSEQAGIIPVPKPPTSESREGTKLRIIFRCGPRPA